MKTKTFRGVWRNGKSSRQALQMRETTNYDFQTQWLLPTPFFFGILKLSYYKLLLSKNSWIFFWKMLFDRTKFVNISLTIRPKNRPYKSSPSAQWARFRVSLGLFCVSNRVIPEAGKDLPWHVTKTGLWILVGHNGWHPRPRCGQRGANCKTPGLFIPFFSPVTPTLGTPPFSNK